jgi:hypothetical protein
VYNKHKFEINTQRILLNHKAITFEKSDINIHIKSAILKKHIGEIKCSEEHVGLLKCNELTETFFVHTDWSSNLLNNETDYMIVYGLQHVRSLQT